MPYFYADGVDKSGNRLLTSYGKADQAKRYRAGSEITQGEKFLTIQADGNARVTSEDDGNGLLVRTLMVNSNPEGTDMSGRFVVYAKVNGRWQPTDFRYKNYAAANAAVKSALINLYPACAVIEQDEQGNAPVSNVPVATSEDTVF